MQTSTTISFVRHGHVHNPEEVYYGRLPNFRLSALGREQAQRAGSALKQYPITTIYSSPMLRAQQTAQIIQTALDPTPPIHTAEALVEVHTPHDGRSRAELAARDWDLYSGSPAAYEQPADVVARTRAFMEQMRRDHGGEHILAITHGDVITFASLWALGLEPVIANKPQLRQHIAAEYPDTASITTLTFDDPAAERPELIYLNPHTAPEMRRK